MSSTAPAPPVRGGHVADEKVLILDFGSQYAQLIARRVREQHVYCEIVRHSITAERIRELHPRGIILSGGPSSVYADSAPKCDPQIFRLGIPVLGICYGMQLACEVLGGKVKSAAAREYGRAQVEITSHADLFAGVPNETEVWMSHGDQVAERLGRVRGHRPHVDLPDCRGQAPHAADLRLAVSSRSDAHAARAKKCWPIS